ncbi:MAG: hypothetical protein MJA30_07755 [Cytophagales bacterium]|nr:hypothetical protein [Cytophagales bacterium]
MKKFKFNVVTTALSVVLMFSCQIEDISLRDNLPTVTSPPLASEVELESDYDLEDPIALYERNEQLPTLADLHLRNGNILRFYGQDSDLPAVLVLEEGECNNCSGLSDVFGLARRELNPLEIFWSLSSRGDEVPRLLYQLYRDESGSDILDLGQGWAAAKLDPGDSGPTPDPMEEVACNNENFVKSIGDEPFFGGLPNYVALDKTPQNYSSFESDCYNPAASGDCWGAPRYQLRAEFLNIKKWKGKICAKNIETIDNTHEVLWCGPGCSKDSDCEQPGSCSVYQGPLLLFQYFWKGKWRLIENGGKKAYYHIPANSRKTYWWMGYTPEKTKFRLRIRYAKPLDEFDLMMDK